MTDVTPLLKVKVDCPCGEDRCDKFGTPKRNGHVKGCPCIRCRNKRSRDKGDTKARHARHALGLAGANTRHEELWGGSVLTEVKAGGKAKPVRTAYENSRAQSDAARALGDTRPFVASFCADGSSHVYFVVRSDDLERFCFALVEMWGAA